MTYKCIFYRLKEYETDTIDTATLNLKPEAF